MLADRRFSAPPKRPRPARSRSIPSTVAPSSVSASSPARQRFSGSGHHAAQRDHQELADDGIDRGLIFVAVNANITRQFEFVQQNWIGKSRGMRFRFQLAEPAAGHDGFEVFTTRPDTIFGASFAALSPDHPIALALAAENEAIASFVAECKKGGTTEAELAAREKEGLPTGLVVFHPITDEPVDVWVGNYVLMGYGDGAVMGVPGHDERAGPVGAPGHAEVVAQLRDGGVVAAAQRQVGAGLGE